MLIPERKSENVGDVVVAYQLVSSGLGSVAVAAPWPRWDQASVGCHPPYSLLTPRLGLSTSARRLSLPGGAYSGQPSSIHWRKRAMLESGQGVPGGIEPSARRS